MPNEPFVFRDCACPGTPHPAGDTVTFREKLSFNANAAALLAVSQNGQAQDALEVFLTEGLLAWNLIDEEGEAVPLSKAALLALDFTDQYAIANQGDSLYADTVLSPLVRKIARSSGTGPTTGSPRRTKKPSRTRAR